MFQRFLASFTKKELKKLACAGNGALCQEKLREFEQYCLENREYTAPVPERNADGTLPEEEIEENVPLAGDKKSAAKWIEEAQRKLKNAKSTEEADQAIARIFAARQLGEAVRDQRENIDQAILSESQIKRRANDLLHGGSQSEVFQRFLSTLHMTPLTRKGASQPAVRYSKEALNAALTGHGGALEDKLRVYVHSIRNADQINHRLYHRYKPESYANYTEFLQRNRNARYTNPSAGDFRQDPLKMAHAKTMMAAYRKLVESRNRPFHRAELEEQIALTDKDPMFFVMSLKEERLNLLNAGTPAENMDAMQQIFQDFEPKISFLDRFPPAGNRKGFDVNKIYLTRKAVEGAFVDVAGGKKGKSLKAYIDGNGPAFRQLWDCARDFVKEANYPNTEGHFYVFGACAEYLKGREKQNTKEVKAVLKVMKAVVEGTPAEKYMKEYLLSFNEKRGLAPSRQESRKWLSFEKIPSIRQELFQEWKEEYDEKHPAQQEEKQEAVNKTEEPQSQSNS